MFRNFTFNQIMVNITYQQENTTCGISNKNILRRDSSEIDWHKMGSQHGHLLHEMHPGSMCDVEEALQNLETGSGGKIKRYDPAAILALRDDPLSKAKPTCADERPFWINGKSYGKFCLHRNEIGLKFYGVIEFCSSS